MSTNTIHQNRQRHNFDRYHNGLASTIQRKIRNFFKAIFRMA
jgi:hypothetical protein